MAHFISFDSGGTKSFAMLFDEHGSISSGQSGGTNTNFTTPEDCRRNVAECLDRVLEGTGVSEIETLYYVLVGPRWVVEEELTRRVRVGRFVSFGEGEAGILAGALKDSGLVAIAGTGSDVFYIPREGRQASVGGMGAILGDDGSGALIGQRALRAAIAHDEGWGEPTLLRDLFFERWKLRTKWDLCPMVYQSIAPFRKVASAVPIVAEAARMGDQLALRIFQEAGEAMTTQMCALIRQEALDSSEDCVCCGGAWKAHPAMYDAFTATMRERAPHIRVHKPIYEHFMAGIVRHLLDERPGISPDEVRESLARAYRQYEITW